MAADREPAIEAFIHDGRRAYGSKNPKKALQCFTYAMKQCSCTRKMKRARCCCKRFEEVAAEGGSIFKEAMYTCKCDVGRTFSKCSNSLHLQALDYRAATWESMGELERARKDAEWMLELSPRAPDGYLRLGKIARLQKKNEFAWNVFDAGIETGLSNDLTKSDPKMEKLFACRKPLHNRYCRHDPLALPVDIVHEITSHLSFPSLLRCLGVCWQWRRYLTNPAMCHLWRSLDFPMTPARRNPPSTQMVKKLLGWSRHDLRRLTIRHAASARFGSSKLDILLKGARHMEQLEIHQANNVLKDCTHPWPRNLQILTLIDTACPTKLWEAVAGSLTYLHLGFKPALPNRGGRNVPVNLPVLPSLRYLRMSGDARMTTLTSLCKATPNLQQIWCNSFLQPTADELTGNDLKELLEKTWTQLEVVIFDGINGTLDFQEAFHLMQLVSIDRGSKMKYIELSSSHEDHEGFTFLRQAWDFEAAAVLMSVGMAQPEATANTFKNLRGVRLKRMAIDGIASEEPFHTPLQNGNLASFDINFPALSHNELLEGMASCRRMRTFDWLRNAESIRSLGVTNFRFRRFAQSEEDLPLLGFLASFPNLETLEIRSEYYEDAELCTVINEVIKVTKLKTVYHNIKGAPLDHLRKAADEAGIELMSGERPRPWPVAFDG